MVKFGTPKQAKHAIRCIDKLCKNKDDIFLQVFKVITDLTLIDLYSGIDGSSIYGDDRPTIW